MSKKKAYVLVGPAVPGVEELHEELGRRSDTLDEVGLAVPPVPPADLVRAGIEIRRTHKAEGLRRKDVEGTWAQVCRAAEKTRSDVLLGQDTFVGGPPEQLALLLDGLAAFQVHVVLTLTERTERRDELIEPWTQAVKAQRLHVLTLAQGDDLDAVLARVGEIALRERAAHLEKRISKLRKKSKKLKKQLAQLDAA
jgi:hypothetical protein